MSGHPLNTTARSGRGVATPPTANRREQPLSLRDVPAKLAEIDAELGAIAAYDEYKEKAGKTGMAPDETSAPRAEAKRGSITREAVLRVVAGAGEAGMGRAAILSALHVKGDQSGSAAVDNCLRDLKGDGKLIHESRTYRVNTD